MKRLLFIMLLLCMTVGNAYAVFFVIGSSVDNTQLTGLCRSFGFTQATPINLSSVEINGQSIETNACGSTWYATVAYNDDPNLLNTSAF